MGNAVSFLRDVFSVTRGDSAGDRLRAGARRQCPLAARRLVPPMACLAAIACLAPSNRAGALPLGIPEQAHMAFDVVACRAPPWFRGWQDVTPWVCGRSLWWPKYYYQGLGYQGLGVRHRHRYRDW